MLRSLSRTFKHITCSVPVEVVIRVNNTWHGNTRLEERIPVTRPQRSHQLSRAIQVHEQPASCSLCTLAGLIEGGTRSDFGGPNGACPGAPSFPKTHMAASTIGVDYGLTVLNTLLGDKMSSAVGTLGASIAVQLKMGFGAWILECPYHSFHVCRSSRSNNDYLLIAPASGP